MKTWDFQINKGISETNHLIQSSFGLTKTFVYDNKYKNEDSVKFMVRKRILYPWYLFFDNSLILNGTLSKSGKENATDISISFNQHFLLNLVVFTDAVIGLAILISALQWGGNRFTMVITGAIFVIVSILLLLRIKKKYDHDIKQYQNLFSGILDNEIP